MLSSSYPPSRVAASVDQYLGIAVADPYRWLEDATATERAEWVARQRALSASYLARGLLRAQLVRRFGELLRYVRHYDLQRAGPYLFFRRSAGVQDQPKVYAQRGLEAAPRLLLDPASVDDLAVTRVDSLVPSTDGEHLLYELSRWGSDWLEYHVMDTATGWEHPEKVKEVKFSSPAWREDGFYYSRFRNAPQPAQAHAARSDRHQQIWYHQLGTQQSADRLVYEDEAHPLRLYFTQSVEHEQSIAVTVRDGAAKGPGSALWLLDGPVLSPKLRPLVASFDHSNWVVGSQAGRLLILTNAGAPLGRLVAVDPARPDVHQWDELISEHEHRLEAVAQVGGHLLATYREHGSHRLHLFDGGGKHQEEIALPEPGSLHVSPGRADDAEALWSFSSFTSPPTIYRYDLVTRRISAFLRPEVPYPKSLYRTTRVFLTSKDGTRLPMFIVRRKGTRRHGRNRVLVYGYGGNGATVGPAFDPLLIALLEQGIVYASPCLRGGGEYGERWHAAGRRERKQNTFDDAIACLEWLHRERYSAPERTALSGTSNGGLMVAAVMTQRPDLLGVALPDGGVMDMLRYQHFTAGAHWAPEYGTSDDPAMFPVLLRYSPLHNVQRGVRYPATLVLTSEHDDRVVPAHSFKFVAALQNLGAGPGPYLIRIERHSGHGAVNLTKLLDERADAYAFLLTHLGGPQVQGSRLAGASRTDSPGRRSHRIGGAMEVASTPELRPEAGPRY